jgi:hypothetical protein
VARAAAGAGLIAVCGFADPAAAGTITLDFTLKGAFTSQGLNNGAFNAAPGNTLVGFSAVGHRGYWVFDLSGVTDNILSATLRIGMPFGGYFSADPTETMAVYDYGGDIAKLQNQSTVDTGVYGDLGSGAIYGTRTLSEADEADCSHGCTINSFNYVDIALGGADFTTDANAARGGLFTVGGALTTIVGTASQIAFGFTGNNIPAQLVLDTGPAALAAPEPATLGALLAGLAALGLMRRRRPSR